MSREFSYLIVEEIIEFNLLVIDVVRVKKADRHQVLSNQKILAALEKCSEAEGDLYQKAAVLMRTLIGAHAFASGNRRTAFIATKEFVLRNKGVFSIPDDPHYANVMRQIREGKYTDAELAEWIKHGKIEKRER